MNDKIKNMYDEIHAPEALLGKVMEMKKEEFKGRMMVKYIAAAVLALVVTVVASNGICYAATGETWIGKMKVWINGVETEQEVTWQQDGDVLYGVMEMEVEEGEPFEMEIVTEGEETDRFEEVVIVAVTTEADEEEDETETDEAPESDETEAE